MWEPGSGTAVRHGRTRQHAAAVGPTLDSRSGQGIGPADPRYGVKVCLRTTTPPWTTVMVALVKATSVI